MQLHPAAVWSESGVSADLLERDTHDRKLSLSEGTAGHVWRSRKPVWTTNIALDMCLPRSLDATSAGLHGGVWFALKTDAAVYGVIELGPTPRTRPRRSLGGGRAVRHLRGSSHRDRASARASTREALSDRAEGLGAPRSRGRRPSRPTLSGPPPSRAGRGDFGST